MHIQAQNIKHAPFPAKAGVLTTIYTEKAVVDRWPRERTKPWRSGVDTRRESCKANGIGAEYSVVCLERLLEVLSTYIHTTFKKQGFNEPWIMPPLTDVRCFVIDCCRVMSGGHVLQVPRPPFLRRVGTGPERVPQARHHSGQLVQRLSDRVQACDRSMQHATPRQRRERTLRCADAPFAGCCIPWTSRWTTIS